MTVYPCDPRSGDKDVAWGKIKYHSVQQWFWTTSNNKEKMHVLNLPMIPCEKRLYPWFFTKASDDDSRCSGVSTTAWGHITHRSIRMLFSGFFFLFYLKRERLGCCSRFLWGLLTNCKKISKINCWRNCSEVRCSAGGLLACSTARLSGSKDGHLTPTTPSSCFSSLLAILYPLPQRSPRECLNIICLHLLFLTISCTLMVLFLILNKQDKLKYLECRSGLVTDK